MAEGGCFCGAVRIKYTGEIQAQVSEDRSQSSLLFQPWLCNVELIDWDA